MRVNLYELCKLAIIWDNLNVLNNILLNVYDTLYYILRHTLCNGVQVWKGCKICWCALTNCWDSEKMMMFAYEWEPAGTGERYSKSGFLSFNRTYNLMGILSDISNGLANPENSAKLSITITILHETSQPQKCYYMFVSTSRVKVLCSHVTRNINSC